MRTRCGRGSVWVVAAALLLGAAAASEPVSPNAEALWQGITGGTGGSLADVVGGTDTPYSQSEIRRFYNSFTAELYADVMVASVGAQRMFRSALPSIADYCQSAHLVTNSYCEPGAKWVMWDTPFMSRDIRDRNDGYLGYKETVSGFATGISRMLGEATAVGLAVGYDARKLTGQDNYHWRNKADAFHAALYGGTALGCFFVDGYAGYSRSWQRTERLIHDPELNQLPQPEFQQAASAFTNKANFNDTVLSAGLKASYVWILPNDMRITPAIGLDYSRVRMGGFAERSGGLYPPWRVSKSTHDSLQVPLTVSVNKTFSSDFLTFGGKCSLWTPEIRAGYIPQFGAKRTGVEYTVEGVPISFTAQSTKFGGSYGTVGAGLKIKLKDKFIFAVDYDYTFGSKYDNHLVTATYGVSF